MAARGTVLEIRGGFQVNYMAQKLMGNVLYWFGGRKTKLRGGEPIGTWRD